MAHAELVHGLEADQNAIGATAALVDFVSGLSL